MPENEMANPAVGDDPNTNKAPREREPQHEEKQGGSSGTNWAIVLIPIGVSVFSLFISAVSFFISFREPQVALQMPEYVRLWQPEDKEGNVSLAQIYIQPHFLYAGTSQRAEVITQMRLFIDPEGDATPIECLWMEQGRWSGSNFQLSDRTDPGPMVIDPTTAALPVARFEPILERWANWQLEPGRYKLTLRAERAVADEPLEATMNITVHDAHMNQIRAPDQWAFVWANAARKPSPSSEEVGARAN